MKKVIFKISVMFLSVTMISCSGNFEGSSVGFSTEENISTGLGVDSGVSEKTLALMNEVNEAEKNTETLFKEVEDQESTMKKIDILSFLLAIPFKATTETTPSEKLSNPIKSVLAKVMKAVDKAYALDSDIRIKLENIVADLNPEIPSHAKAIEKIDKMHIKLDNFILKLDNSVVKLMVSANKIITKINLKASTYFPIDPRALLLKKAKEYFDDFKDDLQSYLDENGL